MTKYQKYLQLMNRGKKQPLPELTLRDMWGNWLCEDEDEKKSFHAYGLGSHWRETQLRAMRELNIDEPLQFRRGGDVKAKLIKFTDSTKHLFATSQNAIARRSEFYINARGSV